MRARCLAVIAAAALAACAKKSDDRLGADVCASLLKGEATFVGLPDDQGSLKDCRPRPGVTADGKRVLKELALKYSSGARLTLTLHYSGDSEPKLVGARVGGLEGAEKVQAQADWASAFSKGLK